MTKDRDSEPISASELSGIDYQRIATACEGVRLSILDDACAQFASWDLLCGGVSVEEVSCLDRCENLA
jgi:hypothetical protein